LELGEELVEHKRKQTRFTEVHDGNKSPIKIVNPAARRLMGWSYYPDAYYVTKFAKKLIFEVIDAESPNEIISDYTQGVLCQAWGCIFITKREKLAEVSDVVTTVHDILKELNMRKVPHRDVFSLEATTASDRRGVKRELNAYLDRYWY
jgi:hypothetical protein